ncbi:hypothetical protein ElyMa_001331600, partial [Elysia marginata]
MAGCSKSSPQMSRSPSVQTPGSRADNRNMDLITRLIPPPLVVVVVAVVVVVVVLGVVVVVVVVIVVL